MKKALALVLLLAMAISVAACAGGPAATTAPSAATSAAVATASAATGAAAETATPAPVPPSDPVRVTFFWREGGDIHVPEDSYIVEKIQKDLNIIYEHITPAGGMTQEEMLQVRLTAREVPDIMESYNEQTVNLRNLGAIIPIQDYVNEQYIPNVIRNQHNWDAALALVTKADGQIWELPVTMANDVEVVPYIRYDWLRNLGLEMPTTVDELANVLAAFTNDDPDGNGQDDTVGVMWHGASGISTNMGGLVTDWVSDGAGGLKLRLTNDTVREYNRYLKGLIDSGAMDGQIVDPDVLQGTKITDWIKAGKVGYNFSYNNTLDLLEIRKVQPDAEWGPCPPIKGIYDKGYRPIGATMRQTYVISAFTEDRLEAVWRLLDYMANDDSTEDHLNFDAPYWEVSFGERGVNWDVIDGKFMNTYQEAYPESQVFKDNNDAEPWNTNCRRFRTIWQFQAMNSGWSDEERTAWETIQTYPRDTEWVFGADPNYKLNFEGIDLPDEVAEFQNNWFASENYSAYQVEWLLGRSDLDSGFADMVAQAEADGIRDIEKIMTDYMREQGKIQ